MASGGNGGEKSKNQSPAEEADLVEEEGGLETAQFAAGCFWGVELAFQRVPGVVRTEVGFSQGRLPEPSYADVCRKDTGHAEVVRLHFDPTVCPYSDLLNVFWNRHDPTTLNRQKAWLIAQDFKQEYDIDYNEIFSRMAKTPSIRILLIVALIIYWLVMQLDVFVRMWSLIVSFNWDGWVSGGGDVLIILHSSHWSSSMRSSLGVVEGQLSLCSRVQSEAAKLFQVCKPVVERCSTARDP